MTEPQGEGEASLEIPGLPEAEALAALPSSGEEVALAWRENALLSAGKSPEELKAEADMREHGRNQRFKDHFERLAILALWVSAAAIVVIGLVWLWHLVAPPCRRWLTTEDISHLQSIATTGLLVGVIGNHMKKRLG